MKIKLGLTRIIGLGMLLVGILSLCGVLTIIDYVDKEKQIREQVEGTITEVSEVWEERMASYDPQKPSTHDIDYYQNFSVVYDYEGESYKVAFDRCLLNSSEGFTNGDNEIVYVDKDDPENIMLGSFVDGDPTVILIVLYGVIFAVSLIFIFIPQGRGGVGR